MTQAPNPKKEYNLEERTAKFGEEIIKFCKKESRECKHFLRMSAVAAPETKERARKLWAEAKELNLIFNSIYNKVK